MVIVTTWDCPALRLRLEGEADIVNGAETFTVTAEDVEGALIPT